MNLSSQWELDAALNALRTGIYAVNLEEIDKTYKPKPLQQQYQPPRIVFSFSPTCPQTAPIPLLFRSKPSPSDAPRSEEIASLKSGFVSPSGSSDAGVTSPYSPIEEAGTLPSIAEAVEKIAFPVQAEMAVASAQVPAAAPAIPPVHGHRGSIPIQPVTSGLLSEALRGGNGHGGGGDSDSEVGYSLMARSRSDIRGGRDGDRMTISSRVSDNGSIAGEILRVIVYLPSKAPIHLKIPDAATVHDTIAEVLRQVRTNNITPALPGDARCYELRLHDEDGEPDDDFPALDKTRKIRNFAQGGAHEYCLRPMPSALAAWRASHADGGSKASGLDATSTATADMPGGASPLSNFSSIRSGAVSTLELAPQLASLRVIVPGHPTPTACMVPVRDGTRIQEVIEYVAKRHRLPVFYDRYVIKVSLVDQMRLSLPSRELPPHMIVAPLALDSVELSKKTFADTPPDRPSATKRGLARDTEASSRYLRGGYDHGRDVEGSLADSFVVGGGTPFNASAAMAMAAGSVPTGPATSSSLARPTTTPSFGPGGLMHNAITAAQFQEWHVMKTNKRGRRQERLMGIDLTRITNRKVEKKRFISDKTVNAERLISDIKLIEIPEKDPTAFAITFRESGGEDVTLSYETRAPREREEIVSKLAFILKMNGDQHKIVRT